MSRPNILFVLADDHSDVYWNFRGGARLGLRHGDWKLIQSRTDELRQIIAMVYNRYFYKVMCWMPFAKGTEDFFQHPTLQALCNFVDEEQLGVDYIWERQQQALPNLSQIQGVACGGQQV